MALEVGQHLGSYEITALLGKGGMGEVYRARDLKLKREVAIKILPEEFSGAGDRVSRFQREAEVLASLNHPNIAAIYDLQEANETRFLVLELVDGEALAERIQRGPIAVAEALKIAHSICEALEAAHEKGIIHRDLKPANIKVTPEGKVKVLDFGLAKAFAPEQSNTPLSQSPTLSIAATNAGVFLGTAAYMSPEQARGSLRVDTRCDIWAFGCVLYEMLTGRQAFDGDSIPEVLASVLAREVDYSRLSPELNPRLRELIRRCLQKDVKKRWQAVGDLRVEIETILADPAAAAFEDRRTTGRWSIWKVAAVALIAAIAGAGIAAALLRIYQPAPAAEVMRFAFILPDGQAFRTEATRQVVAVSPDGKSFVYVAGRQLYLRRMDDNESRPIPAGNAVLPFFSPDGHWIGFFQDGQLKKIAVTGGAAVPICSVAGQPFGATWYGNTIFFIRGTQGIFAVSEDGGTPEQWLKGEPGEYTDNPQILPGGKSVMFSVTRETGPDRWDKGNIVVVTRATGERKVLIAGGGARYVSTGHLLYALGSNLMAVRFDVEQLKVVGSPVQVVDGVLRSPSLNGSSTGNFDLSANGTLVYVPKSSGLTVVQRVLTIVDGHGKSDVLRLPPGTYANPRVSPNGKQVAVNTSDDGLFAISIYDLSGTSSLRKLTLEGTNVYPRWSPDSRKLAFSSVKDGKAGIFLQNADGTGSPENLIGAPVGDTYIPWTFDPSGKVFLFTNCKGGNDCGIFMTPVAGERKIQTFADQPQSGQYNAAFRYDGQWVAYVSSEGQSRVRHIFVQQFPSGAKYQISREPSEAPVWSPDGKELFYYQTETSKLVSVRIQTQPAISFSNPVPLPIERMIQDQGSPRDYDIMPDGRFLISQPASQPSAGSRPSSQINVVLNWFSELTQRVPVK
jgi:serine/threonine-protein kinase